MAKKEEIKAAAVKVEEEVKAVAAETAKKATKATKAAAEKTTKATKAAAEKTTKAAEKAVEKTAETAEKAVKTVKKAAKKDMKTTLTVQFMGKEVTQDAIVAAVKKAWTDKKNKIGDIKTMDLYVKVEENKAYYVINGDQTGSVEL